MDGQKYSFYMAVIDWRFLTLKKWSISLPLRSLVFSYLVYFTTYLIEFNYFLIDQVELFYVPLMSLVITPFAIFHFDSFLFPHLYYSR